MKRSEMIEHIAAEMVDAEANRKYSNEPKQDYYLRKATGLLDMIQGFGMLPPTVDGIIEVEKTNDEGLALKLWSWEPEDETK
jgi:hypothetical protein